RGRQNRGRLGEEAPRDWLRDGSEGLVAGNGIVVAAQRRLARGVGDARAGIPGVLADGDLRAALKLDGRDRVVPAAGQGWIIVSGIHAELGAGIVVALEEADLGRGRRRRGRRRSIADAEGEGGAAGAHGHAEIDGDVGTGRAAPTTTAAATPTMGGKIVLGGPAVG